jgi:hypothetical protein
MAKVFLACPSHSGQLDAGAARGLYASASRRHQLYVSLNAMSLLSQNCNALWADALNRREEGYEWFAMLHSDIDPEFCWLDRLIDEAERQGADLLSAVVPIKDRRGLTSTAIASPVTMFAPFCRLTMRQVRHPQFPATFDLEAAAAALETLPPPFGVAEVPRTKLLCNTGCFVCRLDRPWCDGERVYFDDLNRVLRVNGRWEPGVHSEDWFFTGRVAEQGGKVMATTAIKVIHTGVTEFSSDEAWGADRDEQGLRVHDLVARQGETLGEER